MALKLLFSKKKKKLNDCPAGGFASLLMSEIHWRCISLWQCQPQNLGYALLVGHKFVYASISNNMIRGRHCQDYLVMLIYVKDY